MKRSWEKTNNKREEQKRRNTHKMFVRKKGKEVRMEG